jgi:predicted transcriptional regulator
MSRLGRLERAVMEILWSAAEALTAREVHNALPTPDLASTTVLTVLDRLGRKGLVIRQRHGRAYRYRPVGTREDHIAERMRAALGTTAERGAALARFRRFHSRHRPGIAAGAAGHPPAPCEVARPATITPRAVMVSPGRPRPGSTPCRPVEMAVPGGRVF